MNRKNAWSVNSKTIVMVILILGAVWLLCLLRPLLTALVMASLCAYLFDPLSRKLSRRTRLTRAGAARAVFAGLLFVLVSIPVAVGAMVFDQFHSLEYEFFTAIAAIEQWITQPIDLLGYRLFPEVLVNNLEAAAEGTLASIPGESLNFLSDVSVNMLWMLVLLLSLYYFLKDGYKLGPWLIQVVPCAYQQDIRRLLAELDEVWGAFLRVQLLMFIILTILIMAGFLLVIWLFRLELIPFSPLTLILLLALVVTVAQQIDDHWLRPLLMGKSLHMHPGLVFGGLTGALMVGGFLVTFFVVPLMGSVRILGRYIYCQLFDLPPWPDEPVEVDAADVFKSDSAQPHKPGRWHSQQQQDGLSGKNMLPKS